MQFLSDTNGDVDEDKRNIETELKMYNKQNVWGEGWLLLLLLLFRCCVCVCEVVRWKWLIAMSEWVIVIKWVWERDADQYNFLITNIIMTYNQSVINNSN